MVALPGQSWYSIQWLRVNKANVLKLDEILSVNREKTECKEKALDKIAYYIQAFFFSQDKPIAQAGC